jgi:hypothetical protein
VRILFDMLSETIFSAYLLLSMSAPPHVLARALTVAIAETSQARLSCKVNSAPRVRSFDVLLRCAEYAKSDQAEMIVKCAVPSIEASPPRAVFQLHSFALYALSRGSGLSASGQRAIAEFRDLLRSMKADGGVVHVSETRIGIEGETKICAEFATAELAGQVWMHMTQSLQGADLVQLKAEECW